MFRKWLTRVREDRMMQELILNALEDRAEGDNLLKIRKLRRSVVGKWFLIHMVLNRFEATTEDLGDGALLEKLLEFIQNIDWAQVMEIIMFILEKILPLFMKRVNE